MKFTILRPQEKQEFNISWLEINTTIGNMVIQRGHAPMILSIPPKKALTVCLQNGKQETFETSGGIIEIQRSHITFLVND